MVIDLLGLSEAEVGQRFPAVYQHLLDRVKPARDQNKRAAFAQRWWIFGEPRKVIRPALESLPRCIVTVETTKHRTFQFLPEAILPDPKLIVLALDDAAALAVLSSRIHRTWSLAQGALLEDRPVYPKSQCFSPFPFPTPPRPRKPACAPWARSSTRILG